MPWNMGLMGATGKFPSFVGATGEAYAYLQTQPRTVGFSSSAVPGVQAGDLMLVMLSDDYTNNDWVQSGWTQVFYRTAFDATSTVAFWYKYATSSDTTFSLSKSGTGSSGPAITLSVFRGVSYHSYSNTTVDTNVSPSITVPTSGSVVVVGAFGQDELTPAELVVPSGYQTASSVLRNNTSSMATGYKLNVPSGIESPGDFSGISVTNYMDVISVVLTPN